VEVDGRRACALVAQALALHERLGTVPPPEFARWRKSFGGAEGRAAGGERAREPVDAAVLERSASLLEMPELGGWFVDPARVATEALALLQARESRLVVSDHIRAEREAAILDGVIEAHVPTAARLRWAGRLREMADIFGLTGRDEAATLARQSAAALADADRPVTAIPFVRALAARGLEMAAEVALGRARLDDVSRAPARRARS
jgi:hypothetical protein